MTERTIPQRLLDRSIEHTAKINVYGLKEDLQQTSRMGIDSFNSEVLLTGEVPTETLKAEVEKVVSSMPDVRRVYNEMEVSALSHWHAVSPFCTVGQIVGGTTCTDNAGSNHNASRNTA